MPARPPLALVPGNLSAKSGPPCRRCFSRITTLTAAGFVGRGCNPRPCRTSVPSGPVSGLTLLLQPALAPFDWVRLCPSPSAGKTLGACWANNGAWSSKVATLFCQATQQQLACFRLQQWLGAASIAESTRRADPLSRPGWQDRLRPAGGLVGPTSRGADWRANPPPPLWLSFHACGEATSARCGKPLRATRASSPMASPAWRSTGWLQQLAVIQHEPHLWANKNSTC